MKNENSPLIRYSKLFNKQRKATPLEIKKAFRDALELFLETPNHPALRVHNLKEKLEGYMSIDVTDNYRALYKKKLEGDREVIIFHLIGTHEELYGT